jgi:hypothetical protein
MPIAGAIALAVLAVAVLVALQVRHVRHVRAQRGAVLDDVAPLFADAEVTQDGIGFPSLTGTYDGDRVKVELVVDTLALRELPRLWLVVTVFTEVAIAGPVDVLLRPRTADIVSPGGRFAHEHAPPAGWPADVRIATAQPEPPPFAALEDALPLLEDERTKALTVTPRGVRVVQLLAKGQIGQYRVVRRAKFEAEVERAQLTAMIDAAVRIAHDVEVSAGLEKLLAGADPA